MRRTNIVLDMELVDRAKALYGFKTAREAVDHALRELVADGVNPYELALKLQGSNVVVPIEEIRPWLKSDKT